MVKSFGQLTTWVSKEQQSLKLANNGSATAHDHSIVHEHTYLCIQPGCCSQQCEQQAGSIPRQVQPKCTLKASKG